ncbi:MAG: hypothetical protein WCQ32_01405 [bacterium]
MGITKKNVSCNKAKKINFKKRLISKSKIGVPRPVRGKNVSVDPTEKYLCEWKKLFESIHPEIKVFLKNKGDNCSELLDGVIGSVQLESYFNYPEIFVSLPSECGMHFLAGLPYNKMFSDVEIAQDIAYFEQDGNMFDCEPKTKPWEYFYYSVHEFFEQYKKRIPFPPSRPL